MFDKYVVPAKTAIKLPMHVPAQVAPDWTTRGTKESLEKDIGNGFEIKGPGWYLSDTDTILVQLNEETDSDRGAWSKQDGEQVQYIIYVYNTRLENTIWNEIGLVKTREDKRGD